jgi:hypothetical protein
MTTFDYVFPLLLILSVLRQTKGKRLTWFQLAWPIGIVAWAATQYVGGFPATSADLILVATSTALGAGLGALAGLYTTIYRRADGALVARATLATVVLWTLGTVGRLVFGLYAEHGGGPTIVAFSAAHGLAVHAWAAALTLMALAEVLGRTITLAPRVSRAPPSREMRSRRRLGRGGGRRLRRGVGGERPLVGGRGSRMCSPGWRLVAAGRRIRGKQ